MKAFAALLDKLSYAPGRNAKLALMQDYFASQPDPDRGYGLAALTGDLEFAHAKPAMLRALVSGRVDEELFRLSYDYVGDLAETTALIWPSESRANRAPELHEIVETLQQAKKQDVPGLIESWLDALDEIGRWALLKLMTGGLRVGVSARLAKTALARYGSIDLDEIEELWHGLEAPYVELFAWAEARADKPNPVIKAPFRPMMLAHPLEEADREKIDPSLFRAEWKWDGIRVQAVREGETARLFSRTGEEITRAFPDVTDALQLDTAIDGELLVIRDGEIAPFGDLQKRLNRKTVSSNLLESHPAGILAYDLLWWGGDDLRSLSFDERRRHLEQMVSQMDHPRLLLSPLLEFTDLDHLEEQRNHAEAASTEGVMLKRGDSAYVAGRPKGPWFKWKRDPFLIDAVLLYAQRGHGKRSSFYSDYTFGVWDEDRLVPVGKAYFGFTDAELRKLDKFVRSNTLNRFGPVREVAHGPDKGLVFEVAFEGLQRSKRHKSGLAMRFPRIHRIRWDKPPAEADRLAQLETLLAEIS